VYYENVHCHFYCRNIFLFRWHLHTCYLKHLHMDVEVLKMTIKIDALYIPVWQWHFLFFILCFNINGCWHSLTWLTWTSFVISRALLWFHGPPHPIQNLAVIIAQNPEPVLGTRVTWLVYCFFLFNIYFLKNLTSLRDSIPRSSVLMAETMTTTSPGHLTDCSLRVILSSFFIIMIWSNVLSYFLTVMFLPVG
jgi:hypothetical protein